MTPNPATQCAIEPQRASSSYDLATCRFRMIVRQSAGTAADGAQRPSQYQRPRQFDGKAGFGRFPPIALQHGCTVQRKARTDPLPSLGDVGAGGSFTSPSSHSNDPQPTAALMETPSRAAVNGLLDVASSTIRLWLLLRPTSCIHAVARRGCEASWSCARQGVPRRYGSTPPRH